jgi:hypothetical protein
MPCLKPLRCNYCGEVGILNFLPNHRSVCKKCIKYHRSLTPEERRKNIALEYQCGYCGVTDVSLFHPYCKNKCMKHYAMRNTPPRTPPKIKIVKREEEKKAD